MEHAVLAVWIVTSLAGLHLLVLWLAGGGLRQQETKVTAFPSALVLAHPALAVAGLGLWVAFLGTGDSSYAWAAFGVLTAVALLGFTLFTRWLGGGRHARGAERRFPVVAVALHGIAGVATFVLVLLAATMADRL
ncbi:hypothetical protein [Microtetraspora fusca]|uniref:hypothetical protein n=1 Tax=Microtetraspora fusca TaxID=1997 RepID=UPI00083781CF|nr:hypothetical protein [Microtetraspora fusca]